MMIRKKYKETVAVIGGICLLAVISIAVLQEPLDDAGIVFVDVGQGDCIHVKTVSGKNYLIDGGGDADYDVGRKILKPYLLKNGVRKVDCAFVTHLHEDHYGGIRSLAGDGMVDCVAVYDANRLIAKQLIKETGAKLMFLHGGNRITLDEDCYIEVIAPEAGSDELYREMINDSENENACSLIMKLCYKGKTVLITGDIDEEGETQLLNDYGQMLDSDIMKVPHHGSKYSSSADFIKTVSPVLAVFQVGRNNYGHPSTEVIKKYEQSGCSTVRNDTDGAIGVSVEGEALKVVRMIH